MMQIYFLSIALNFFVGLILIRDSLIKEDEKKVIEKKDSVIKIIVSVLAILTGILKLLNVIPGDIYVIGDLFPSLAGIVGGAALMFSYFVENTSVEIVPGQFLEKLFIKGKKYLGIACIIISILHFLFPKVILI
ncbi:MAG: hypothetical protein GX220_01315 [Treponema sp.]|nr:hypothetical protein [Treponema sp.]